MIGTPGNGFHAAKRYTIALTKAGEKKLKMDYQK